MKEKKNVIWIILLLIIVVFLVFSLGIGLQKQKNSSPISPKEYDRTLVTNASEFFTVSQCLNRYVSYVQASKSAYLYQILDQDYIDENHITEQNIFQYVPSISPTYSPNVRKMYRQRINSNVISYYVYFKLEENVLDGVGDSKDLYSIIYLIENKAIFAVRPYDGEVFNNES